MCANYWKEEDKENFDLLRGNTLSFIGGSCDINLGSFLCLLIFLVAIIEWLVLILNSLQHYHVNDG